MSMECDTRLSMMALRERDNRATTKRRNRRARTNPSSHAIAVASFALTLFTRGV